MDDVQAMERLGEARGQGLAAIETASSLEELRAAEVAALGRRSPVAEVQRSLGTIDLADRPRIGREVNRVFEDLRAAVAARRVALEAEAEADVALTDRIDVTLPGRRPPPGGLHPLTSTSPVQIRTMEAQEPPIYVVIPGRCFRRDTPDATHLPVFQQVEILAVDEGLSLADMKGTLEAWARAMFGPDQRVRIYPDYFPFVEPGAGLDVSCFLCGGRGCRVCGNGWIELLGAGMVHPALFENTGIDPERYSGFAAGLGIERVAMLLHGVPDIRMFYEGDVRFLSQLARSA